jgi:hypothetical protein
MPKDETKASGDAQPGKAARGLVDRGASLRGATTWPVILGEGIVLAVVGAVMWLPTGFGATAMLQILGITVLVTATISAWRLVRGMVTPMTVAAVAFRAGVGLAVGSLVVLGSLVAEQADATTLAVAIVLGVGLVLYGLSVLVGPLVQRVPGAPFPLGVVALAFGLIVVGAFLVIRANSGIEELTEAFPFLGLLLGATGMALVGYALILKPHEDGTARGNVRR